MMGSERSGQTQGAANEPAVREQCDTTRDPIQPSFQSLFREQYKWMRRCLRRFGVLERDLDDVGHEVFLAVHLQLPSYDPSRPLRPWLFVIAYRMAKHYHRARSRHPEVCDGRPVPQSRIEAADEQLVRAEQREMVISALQTIDLEQRSVFMLHELEGMPVPEVAETLGINMNTAYSRLRLARERFARAVQRMRGGEP